MYKGVAAVPPLLMVDDILTITKCSPTASALNATVNSFIENKKTQIKSQKVLCYTCRKEVRKMPRVESQWRKNAQGGKYHLPW